MTAGVAHLIEQNQKCSLSLTFYKERGEKYYAKNNIYNDGQRLGKS